MVTNKRIIPQEFHKNNHTKISLKALNNLSTNSYTLLSYDESLKVNIYNNLTMGIYYIIINEAEYYFNLTESLSDNDSLYIKSKHSAYTIINNKYKPILLYRKPKEYDNSNGYHDLSSDGKLHYYCTSLSDGDEIKIINISNKNLKKGIEIEILSNNFLFYYESDTKADAYVLDSGTEYKYPEQYNTSIVKDLVIKESNEGNISSKIVESNSLITLKYSNDECIIVSIEAQTNSINNYSYDERYKIVRYSVNAEESITHSLSNTVNNYIDHIVIEGRTKLEYSKGTNIQSLEYPAKLIPYSKLLINTYNTHDSDSLLIDLKNNMKSLPSGVSDLFVINANSCEAYYISKVGRMVLTGNENWEILDYDFYTNSKYTTFFCNYELAEYSNNDLSINCNCFPSIKYMDIDPSTFKGNHICLNYEDYPGIDIIMTRDVMIPDIKRFRSFLAKRFITNPIIVEYALKTPKYKKVLLDEYHIKTLFSNTNVNLNINSNVALFYKSTTIN